MHRNVYLTDAYTLEEVNRLIKAWDLTAPNEVDQGELDLLNEAKEQKEIALCYKELDEYNSDNAKARRAGFEDYEDMIYNRGQY